MVQSVLISLGDVDFENYHNFIKAKPLVKSEKNKTGLAFFQYLKNQKSYNILLYHYEKETTRHFCTYKYHFCIFFVS